MDLKKSIAIGATVYLVLNFCTLVTMLAARKIKYKNNVHFTTKEEVRTWADEA